MNLNFTAVFRRFPEGYAAFVEELPGANTQGTTLEEARANLQEAVTMVLEANRQLAKEEICGAAPSRNYRVHRAKNLQGPGSSTPLNWHV
ncbi:MAG TPA: type II toxin-antitoxin system HicB family antitoxin [Verrucomicrobiae bacterium]|nr:type II toxin-antitoxin system HicB family antitoxin [Verrucomicrobiae bacterium]